MLVPGGESWETHGVDIDQLSPEARAWVEKVEPLWASAHRLVAKRPDLDVSDVFHVLRNLQRTPAERLHRALSHGRHRPHGR